MYSEDYENYMDVLCEDEQRTKSVQGMNNTNYEIINLYERRKKEELQKKYNEIVEKEYEELEAVKLYNELIEKFETNLNELVEKYNTESNKVFIKNNNKNFFQYHVNSILLLEIRKKYQEKFDYELELLYNLVEEVRAQLSLSWNKDYQIEVLTKYGILNEKGFLNA